MRGAQRLAETSVGRRRLGLGHLKVSCTQDRASYIRFSLINEMSSRRCQLLRIFTWQVQVMLDERLEEKRLQPPPNAPLGASKVFAWP
jgi:hypothetical protein